MQMLRVGLTIQKSAAFHTHAELCRLRGGLGFGGLCAWAAESGPGWAAVGQLLFYVAPVRNGTAEACAQF